MRMNDTIATLMSRKLCSVDMDDTIAEVEARLAQNGLSWAPVLEDGRLAVGVISASDLLQFHAQQRDASQVRAWQLCTYKPVSVDQDAPLAQVGQAMLEQRIHHVVVTRDAQIVGVVSSLDFVRACLDAAR